MGKTQSMLVDMPEGVREVDVVTSPEYNGGACKSYSGEPYESIGRVVGEEGMHVLRRTDGTLIAMGSRYLTFT